MVYGSPGISQPPTQPSNAPNGFASPPQPRVGDSYGHANIESDAFSSLRRTFTLGYDYFLSKSTDVYAMVMHDSITAFNSGTSFGAGIRKSF